MADERSAAYRRRLERGDPHASGPSGDMPEDERKAGQVKLRLLPRDRRALASLAKRWQTTASEAVARAVRAALEAAS